MAMLLAASIGTGIAGALVTGWLRQRGGREGEPWDPNRFGLDDGAPALTPLAAAPAVSLAQAPEAAPAPAENAKPAAEPKLSEEGMSALAMIGTKFGGIRVNPQRNVSFRTREMEPPDQARMNAEVLQDLNDLEFVVGHDETLACPFQNMVTLQHQEAPMLVGGASTPSMERMLRQKLSTTANNVEKLKGLRGCAVRVKRLGNYVVADHLPGGDGVISPDGKTLVLNKGMRAGKDNEVLRLKAGDTVAIAPDNRAAARGGEFSMYKCQAGTELPERGDSQVTCLSQTIEATDRAAQRRAKDALYMNRQGRDRFKRDFLRHRYQRIDEVQPPPNMERPDVYTKDVARIRRDGFSQRPGTLNPYMDQPEIDAMLKKSTVRLASGEVVQTSASKPFSTPIGTSRASVALAADSHYGTMTKLEGKVDNVKAHAATADPIRHQERYERMRQARGDLQTNRPRSFVDKSGLKQYHPKYLESEQPRNQDPRVSKEPAVLKVSQTLNFGKRGGGREEHHQGFAQAKAARARESSYRQAGGYADGGMVVHELTTSTAFQARVPANKNIRRKEKPYRQILDEHQSAAQDSGNTVDKNLRIYGDAHKPVVRLNRLVRIPGVMAKRGVGDTDLYDPSRPHKVGPRLNYDKDANSKKGVRRDYGQYTNQFVADDPHQSDVRTNAVDVRGQSHAQEFGRQTGGGQANVSYFNENRDSSYDFKDEIEPHVAKGQTMRKSHDPTQKTNDIYQYKQPGAAALRENAYEERMGNAGATSHIRRGLDGAEQPAIRHRDDADVEAEGKTARISALYSQHREKEVTQVHEGLVNARPNSYRAGIETATGRNPTADQKVDLFSTSNATADHHRRAYEEHRPGIVVAKNGDEYTVRIDATGEVVGVAKDRIIGTGAAGTYQEGDRVAGGTVVRADNGKYEVMMDSGERQLVELPEKQPKAGFEVGEAVRVATAGEANLANRAILNQAPARYDGATRTLKASYDGEAHPIGVPRNVEKGTEWFRDEGVVATVNAGTVDQALDRRQVAGQNVPIRPEGENAALSAGVLADGERGAISTSIVYAEPPANLTHRPSHVFANEEVESSP